MKRKPTKGSDTCNDETSAKLLSKRYSLIVEKRLDVSLAYLFCEPKDKLLINF